VETDTREIREIATGGRPKKAYFINGKEVSKWDFEKKEVVPATILKPKGMDAESFAEFCRQAVPDLVQRMYELARQSEDIRAIQIVAKEMADRGYGRATQAVQISVDSRVREAWNIIDVKEITDETSGTSTARHGGEPPEADDSLEGKPDVLH